jgi:hypothetical protein
VWYIPIIQATWEAIGRRISGEANPKQKHETLSRKIMKAKKD